MVGQTDERKNLELPKSATRGRVRGFILLAVTLIGLWPCYWCDPGGSGIRRTEPISLYRPYFEFGHFGRVGGRSTLRTRSGRRAKLVGPRQEPPPCLPSRPVSPRSS